MTMKHDGDQHLRLAYTLIMTVMFLPVLLWPAPLLISDSPVLADTLASVWFLNIALLLLIAVSIDTILYGLSSLKHALYATLWISSMSTITVFSIQKQAVSMLALLFFIHAMRSGIRLFSGKSQWWLWLAWSRDIATTFTLLFWHNLSLTF